MYPDTKKVGMIHTISRKTYNLLEDLLMWAKSQSGKLDFNPQKIDFSKTCQDIVPVESATSYVWLYPIRQTNSKRITIL
jgi:hypothetical protein